MSSFPTVRNPVPNQKVRWVDERGILTQEALRTIAAQEQAQTTRTPTLISGSHALRLNTSASNFADGSLFRETDRSLVYVAIQGSWIYLSGTYSVTQSSIDGLAADLGANDTGLLLYVADYAHLLVWNGNSWTWAPGEQGSGFTVTFLVDPSPADGWQQCNGSNAVQMLSDGTLNPAFVVLPNSPGVWFRQ